ncbi:nucleoid-associated protein YgaU [Paenibacillus phyllosphaerae]|uniref:Nucleoid-associated protein YgaU n=1 Tax=Paenibacillus phyllosphaerae TaxID=274593 RepID=A0A7W5FL64_9BACL|nr:LysM domain-containing protein [Paenibacillus phyllosphaerae]MBB3108880.1 nucleoid-associated protein YgaU [Paenibacillus phyllosphaerae]
MNENQTDNEYRPRSMRKNKNQNQNKVPVKMLLALVPLLLIIAAGAYSLFYGQNSAEQRLTLSGNSQTEGNAANSGEVEGSDTPNADGQAATDGDTPVVSNDEPSNAPTEGSDLTEDGASSGSAVDSDEAGEQGQASSGAGAGSAAEPSDEPKQETSKPQGEKTSSGSSSTSSKTTVKLPTTYKVQEGDTLSTISEKFYHSKEQVSLLAEKNNLIFINDLKVGDTITIPAVSSGSGTNSQQQIDYSKISLPASYLVRSGDTLYRLSKLFYNSSDYAQLISDANKLDAETALKAGMILTIPARPASNQGDSDKSSQQKVVEHTVKEGETLSSISRKYYKSSGYADKIASYNHIADGDSVKVGDVLRIPPIA